MEYLWYTIGFAVTLLGSYIIVRYFIPWFKNIVKENDLSSLLTIVQLFMAAAEKQFGHHMGEEKSEWVIQMVKQQFPKLNENYIQALIDGSMAALELDGVINVPGK